jgi:hypothetical protein
MVFSTFFDKICYNIIFTLCRVDLIRSNACILYLGSPHLRQDQCLITHSLHLEFLFFVSTKQYCFSLHIYMEKWKMIFFYMHNEWVNTYLNPKLKNILCGSHLSFLYQFIIENIESNVLKLLFHKAIPFMVFFLLMQTGCTFRYFYYFTNMNTIDSLLIYF